MIHSQLVHVLGVRPYQERSYCLHLLDDQVFNLLNVDDHVLGVNGYCLDALEDLPVGCMAADDPEWALAKPGVYQPKIARGQTEDQRLRVLRVLEQLIDEIRSNR